MKRNLTVFFSLFLVLAFSSCTFKKEEPKVSTWSDIKISTGAENSTWTVESSENSTWTLSTWKIEDEVKTSKNITVVDWVTTYKNDEKAYEISYKNAENLKLNENYETAQVFIVDQKTGSSVSVLTEDYSFAEDIDSLEKYFDLSVENLKSVLKWIKDFKKEKFELNWQKWFKASYVMEVKDISIKIEQLVFDNGKKMAYLVTKTLTDSSLDSQLQEIVNSFKIKK